MWTQIKKSILSNRDLPSLLLTKLTNIPLNCPNFPSIAVTLSAWEKLHTYIDPTTKIRQEVTSPNTVYDYLIPNLRIHPWLQENILAYKELVTKQPVPHAYALIQLQHFHATHSVTFYDIHKDIWQYLITNYDKSKGLSWFYTLLQNKHNFTKTFNMTNWEKELGTTHSHTEWWDAIQTCYQCSHCTNDWDLMLKILHRSYLTPVRMSLIFPSEPNSY